MNIIEDINEFGMNDKKYMDIMDILMKLHNKKETELSIIQPLINQYNNLNNIYNDNINSSNISNTTNITTNNRYHNYRYINNIINNNIYHIGNNGYEGDENINNSEGEDVN